MKEVCTKMIREAMVDDPLKPVKEVHEESVNNMLEKITDQFERQEFLQTMPSSRAS